MPWVGIGDQKGVLLSLIRDQGTLWWQDGSAGGSLWRETGFCLQLQGGILVWQLGALLFLLSDKRGESADGAERGLVLAGLIWGDFFPCSLSPLDMSTVHLS